LEGFQLAGPQAASQLPYALQRVFPQSRQNICWRAPLTAGVTIYRDLRAESWGYTISLLTAEDGVSIASQPHFSAGSGLVARLRRYRRRWKVERLFAWLQNFRRIAVRYERFAENFLGMLRLACCLILLRGL